jgi:hypothetical protein
MAMAPIQLIVPSVSILDDRGLVPRHPRGQGCVFNPDRYLWVTAATTSSTASWAVSLTTTGLYGYDGNELLDGGAEISILPLSRPIDTNPGTEPKLIILVCFI